MNKLDKLYCKLLDVGFIILKQAIDSGNEEWVQAELEMLHNVPSLVGESKYKRHEYYWIKERPKYIDFISDHGDALAKSKMKTYYVPIWKEMEPIRSDQ